MHRDTISKVLELQQDGEIALGYHDILCGEHIATGAYRTVYDCAIGKDLVVKIEYDISGFENVTEYRIWDLVAGTEYEKWFAPVVRIADNGRILLQKKVKPLPENYELPKRLPAFLTDIKHANFGLYKGHLVACDYSFTLYRLGDMGLNNKTRKADWY